MIIRKALEIFYFCPPPPQSINKIHILGAYQKLEEEKLLLLQKKKKKERHNKK